MRSRITRRTTRRIWSTRSPSSRPGRRAVLAHPDEAISVAKKWCKLFAVLLLCGPCPSQRFVPAGTYSEAQEGMSAIFFFSSRVEYMYSSTMSHACPSWDIFECSFSGQVILVFSEFPFQHVAQKKVSLFVKVKSNSWKKTITFAESLVRQSRSGPRTRGSAPSVSTVSTST